MNKQAKFPRIAYIKAGNVKDELLKVRDWSNIPPTGGPLAYTYQFVHKIIKGQPALLLSHETDSVKTKVEYFKIEAKCLPGSHTSLKSQIRLFKELWKFKPEIVLCGMYDRNLFTTFVLCTVLKTPFVISCHNRIIENSGVMVHIKNVLNKAIFVRAAAVITHGPYLTQNVKELGVFNDKIVEFNWKIKHFDTGNFIGNNEDYTKGGQKKVVLFIGRMVKGKGIYDLFEALKDRILKKRDIRLVYVGDGEDFREFHRHVSVCPEMVYLTGNLEHERLANIIRQAHVVVAPTRSTFPEGLCKVINESFVLGKAVIGPDFGPFPYLIKDGINGLLFKVDSVNDLRRKINITLDEEIIYEQITAGARQSGATVRTYDIDFAKAVNKAFNIALGESTVIQ